MEFAIPNISWQDAVYAAQNVVYPLYPIPHWLGAYRVLSKILAKTRIFEITIKPNFFKVVGDPGIEPGVRLREGVTVPCHTLRPVAHAAKALHRQ